MAGTMLVADDEVPIVRVITDILEEAGFRVLASFDGTETLAVLERERPDVPLTDHMMPHLTGLEFIAQLHPRPDLDLPVILMSAVEPLPVPPVTTFLPKPFTMEAILAAVAARLPAP